MTENRAVVLVVLAGFAVEAGCIYFLVRLDAQPQLIVLTAMLFVAAITLGTVLVGAYYERKEIERGEDPELWRP